MSELSLADALTKLIGAKGLVLLAEKYGGTRLYIPPSPNRSQLVDELGADILTRLGQRYGGDYLKVPLARELRARHYRAIGLSNAKIARKLGVTEGAVNRIFQRMKEVPEKGSADPRQLTLFS